MPDKKTQKGKKHLKGVGEPGVPGQDPAEKPKPKPKPKPKTPKAAFSDNPPPSTGDPGVVFPPPKKP